ncbi:hypothetical protein AVEN_10016-1 [Araneus ventricosus]|uniref:Uncharacterized protein n=1 Tax=Araneus ventricosus TaxID=182803 RepID=A0A4Y2H4X1_ARAVE|nr:hypothetical protein AVEN_10016-1 [Araneus ventricosus]
MLIDDREVLVYVGQESTLPDPGSNGPLYSSQMSSYLLWSVILIVYCYGENKVSDTINLTLLKDTVKEEVESWFGLEPLWMFTLSSMSSMEELSLL